MNLLGRPAARLRLPLNRTLRLVTDECLAALKMALDLTEAKSVFVLWPNIVEVKVTDPFQFNAEALAPGLVALLSPVSAPHDPAVHL